MVEEGPNYSFLYYADYGNTKYVPVCGKPNCPHNNEDCNACLMDLHAGSIAYYDGGIYYVVQTPESQDYELWRMNADGTDHRKVKDIGSYTSLSDEYGQWGCGLLPIFHGGYLYFYTDSYQYTEPTEDGAPITLVGGTTRFFRMALSGSGGLEELGTGGNLDQIAGIYPVKDAIYVKRCPVEEEIKSVENVKDTVMPTYYVERYSITDKTWTRVIDKLPGDVDGARIYFEDDKAYTFVSGEGFYEYDYGTGERVLAAPAPTPGERLAALYQGEYIQVLDWRAEKPVYYFYDREYKLLDQIELDIPRARSSVNNYFATIDGRILLSMANYQAIPQWYLLESEIGTGKMKLYEIKGSETL
jgi:hypothetical protein